MNKSKIFMAVLATTGMGWMPAAMADPVIGFDPCGGGTGTGCGMVYASVWTDITDSGVDQGSIAATGLHTFHSQAAVAAFTNNGAVTTPLGMNQVTPGLQTALNSIGIPTFELTKTLAINDFLFSIVGSGTQPVTFNFTSSPQFVPTPQLSIFYDSLSPTDTSQAVRNGGGALPRGAKCYGQGTSGAVFGCAADGNATSIPAVTSPGSTGGGPVLTAHIVADSSSFTATTPGHGTGSFDLLFSFDHVDSRYFDLTNTIAHGGTGTVLTGERFTGTLTQPFNGFPTPDQMWDATTPGGNQLFKVDSSESFVTAVPEPGSLFLLGLGLAGLGAISRRRSV